MKHALPDTIATQRLTLRAPALADTNDLVAMAHNPNVFATTATLPFPYTTMHAESFVAHAADSADVRAYAITGPDNRLMGIISLMRLTGTMPELGYWLGEPHWGQGYVTEAAIALLASTPDMPLFAEVDARVLESNRGSVRVLEKSGFVLFDRASGTLERHAGKPILIMRWRR
jgi:ribosomal-protein-alanine N-acetyltransferase